ncbi:MAG TPA: alcohol dehydrogenase catalytic domain-containing protein [Candidatus Dormibacteraeota bacterium]|nr:alcohol dehydrogenase catalytic domain-containing protein [Candidatus Dormibacteraeota bacterium]
MKAALLTEFSAPYQFKDVPTPKPGPGDCLVRVRACGICGTDLKISAGAFPDTRLPMIPGHEVAGELVEDAGDMKQGQRVALQVFHPCGRCRWCLLGEETLCPNPPRIGFNRDGGLAEYITVPVDTAIPFAGTLPFEVAGVGMDAVLSPWRALMERARVRSGESVVVIGAGGLGLAGIQISRTAGARVAAVDPVEAHREEALHSGAEIAVEPEAVKQVLDWTPAGGADVVYEASGSRAGLDMAAQLITPGGRLICNGWAPGVEYGMQSSQLVLREITLIGSRAGTRRDIRAVLRALERGQVTPAYEAIPLEGINDAMARLKARQVTGRFVVVFPS